MRRPIFFPHTLEKCYISASLCSPFVYRRRLESRYTSRNVSRVYSHERRLLESFLHRGLQRCFLFAFVSPLVVVLATRVVFALALQTCTDLSNDRFPVGGIAFRFFVIDRSLELL